MIVAYIPYVATKKVLGQTKKVLYVLATNMNEPWFQRERVGLFLNNLLVSSNKNLY